MTWAPIQDLTKEHRALLEQVSGISPEVIEAREYKSVLVGHGAKAQLQRYGFSPVQRNPPALLIPVLSVRGDKTWQIRPDTPRPARGRGP